MLQMPEGAAKLFDFVLVRIFLALCEFKRLEDFFHIVERFAKGLDNLIHLVDGILNGSGRSWLPWRGWKRRLDLLKFRRSFGFRRCFGRRRL
jgi:hypothetical protein